MSQKKGRRLSKDQLATVLAALRSCQDRPGMLDGMIHFDDGAKPLDNDGINALCEDLNTGDIRYVS